MDFKTNPKPEWGSSYPFFSRIINQYNLKTGAEIGVASGGHCEAILQQTKATQLYGIDPYIHREGYNDPMNISQPEFDELFHYTLKRLAPYGGRFSLIRADSKDAAQMIKHPLDFVYIDAEHSYEAVWNDLTLWYPKVRYGGIIGGHDYNHICFPGVTQAIDLFFKDYNGGINYEGEGVWWVRKIS